MLRFHRFQYAKMWTEEYGDPDDPEAFGWIRAWSPYHNAPDGVEYPAVLVTAGLHDGRVNAFHARKIAARWQSATRSSRPILLRIDRSSGHGASSTEHWKRELLDELSFLAHELGGLPALP
jgi:prolyl oligopeptidase